MKTLLFILALFFHVLLIIISTRNRKYNEEIRPQTNYGAGSDAVPAPVWKKLNEFTNDDRSAKSHDPQKATRLFLHVNKEKKGSQNK